MSAQDPSLMAQLTAQLEGEISDAAEIRFTNAWRGAVQFFGEALRPTGTGLTSDSYDLLDKVELELNQIEVPRIRERLLKEVVRRGADLIVHGPPAPKTPEAGT